MTVCDTHSIETRCDRKRHPRPGEEPGEHTCGIVDAFRIVDDDEHRRVSSSGGDVVTADQLPTTDSDHRAMRVDSPPRRFDLPQRGGPSGARCATDEHVVANRDAKDRGSKVVGAEPDDQFDRPPVTLGRHE